MHHVCVDVLPRADAATLFARAFGRSVAELHVGDRGVEATFSLPYRQLDEPTRRMFRLLGKSPVPDFDAYSAAALAGVPRAEAEKLLDGLLDTHLLLEPSPGRFQFHDLIRQHARAAAVRHDRGDARARARTRLADYYLHVGEPLLAARAVPVAVLLPAWASAGLDRHPSARAVGGTAGGRPARRERAATTPAPPRCPPAWHLLDAGDAPEHGQADVGAGQRVPVRHEDPVLRDVTGLVADVAGLRLREAAGRILLPPRGGPEV